MVEIFAVETFMNAVNAVFSWPAIGYLVLGIVIGLVLGAIPGIGGVIGMAIVLPLTLPLTGFEANIMLISIYSGAMYGASISSILINVPGSAAAAATTFDGYPMTMGGRAIDALTISATSSAVGGALTIAALFIITPFISPIVLQIGSPQVFLLAFLGIAMIAVVARRASVAKGIVSGAFGLLIMTIGVAPTIPTPRYTFNSLLLFDGLSYVAILIGMFAVGEMIVLAGKGGAIVSESIKVAGSVRNGLADVLTGRILMIKSAFIGMMVGAVPGAGASASNFFAYTEALRSEKNTHTFGKGDPRGVIAAEASNNGTVAGSVIPAIAFGIPGSAATAILLGGFLMHGIQPGPELFSDNLVFTYSLFLGLLFGNLIILFVGLVIVTRIGEILTRIDTDAIIPIIIVFSMLGAYVLRNNWVDIGTILVFGILAYYMKKYNFSVIALVLGAVLARIAESNLHRSLRLDDSGALIFFQDPISLLLIFMIVLVLFGDATMKRLKPAISAYRS